MEPMADGVEQMRGLRHDIVRVASVRDDNRSASQRAPIPPSTNIAAVCPQSILDVP